ITNERSARRSADTNRRSRLTLPRAMPRETIKQGARAGWASCLNRRVQRMEYQVDLDVFHGPLDLLLYLVKRDEIDLRDIPIARVTEQYVAHLDGLTVLDVEKAGEFLVMAATLMELKSKMLLPRPEEESGEAAE